MTPRRFVDADGLPFPTTILDDRGVKVHARIPPKQFASIWELARDGERKLADGDRRGAFVTFRHALELVPYPMTHWNAAGWLLVAMGEAAIRACDFGAARRPLLDAIACPGTVGNPWVHMLLGVALFEHHDVRAPAELARAYRDGGREIFFELDPKYLAAVERAMTAA